VLVYHLATLHHWCRFWRIMRLYRHRMSLLQSEAMLRSL
jgi:hypothetical protein